MIGDNFESSLIHSIRRGENWKNERKFSEGEKEREEEERSMVRKKCQKISVSDYLHQPIDFSNKRIFSLKMLDLRRKIKRINLEKMLRVMMF